MKEYRTASAKLYIRSVDEHTGKFSGVASAVNVLIPSYNEVVLPGAFKKTLGITGGKVPIFWNHEIKEQIGIGIEAHEDAKGLQVIGQLAISDPDTGYFVQRAREVYTLMKMHAEQERPMGLSIGFRIVDADVVTKKKEQIRQIKEAEVLEYSPTPFPANPKAQVKKVASDTLYDIIRQIRQLDDVEFNQLVASLQGENEGTADTTAEEPDLHSISTALDDVLRKFKM